MKRLFSLLFVTIFVFSAGCAGISKVAYNRFDRGRKVIRIAVIDYHILSQEVVQNALKKLKLEGKETLSPNDIRAFGRLTGADAILFANVSLYAQNYLFYKTFGLVGINIRLVGTADDNMLWEARGKNFALFISTDKALNKLEEKMLVQVAKKLEKDKTTTL